MKKSGLVLLALVACKRDAPSAPSQDADAPLAPATTSAAPVVASATPPAPSIDAAADDDDAGANDFEDQFAYDSDDDVDSGTSDASAVTKKTGYDNYTNARFGFSLDVPRGVTAMPPPENGDGMQWRIGHFFAMTASGGNDLPDLGIPLCAVSKHVTAHSESKSGCFSTGRRDRYIFWERHVIARGVDFSLRFQYSETLKEQLDAIVTHVNASWRH